MKPTAHQSIGGGTSIVADGVRGSRDGAAIVTVGDGDGEGLDAGPHASAAIPAARMSATSMATIRSIERA